MNLKDLKYTNDHEWVKLDDRLNYLLGCIDTIV